MKQASIGFLLLAFILLAAGQPADAFAKKGGDDDGDKTEYRYDDDDDDDRDNDDEDEDDNRDDSSDDEELEVEADVFTDTTIVKVEINDNKTTFSTTAVTKEEVAEVVAEKFDLTKEEVLAVLDFEIEDRSSRKGDKVKVKDVIKYCKDDSSNSTLEVEADVFTDTTVVKVELASGTKHIFDTTATTSADIVSLVSSRYNLATATVAAVLDLEIEDRASRAADRVISSNSVVCDDDRDDNSVGNNNGTTTPRDAELRARIAELQKMLETLIRLFTLRFGS